MASVFCMFWPALRARNDEAWTAGPSAIGSVNGMPSSITSAPACGNALAMASHVAKSGSPALVKNHGGPAGHGTGDGQAELDHVGARLRQRLGDGERRVEIGIARHGEHHQGGASL